MKQCLSILDNFKNKKILLIGSTGFVGKVLLGMLLEKAPSFHRIYVLLRPRNGQASADARFKQEVLSSPVFAELFQQHGTSIGQFLKEHVSVLEGDIGLPDLGLNKTMIEHLSTQVDFIINSAGLVDFFPEIERSFIANTLGAINVAEVAKKCQNAKLIHVSTCYVAGKFSGELAEEPHVVSSPEGDLWDPTAEMDWLSKQIEGIHSASMTHKVRSQAQVNLGKSRAEYWGFQNTYCYTKALAEAVLLQNYHSDISLAIVRPSIIESALSFPFKGWNEGFNTTAPLFHLYLYGKYPYLVAKSEVFLDLIPVDVVCQDILLIASAMQSGHAETIYQLSSSHCNPMSVKDSVLAVQQWRKNNNLAEPPRLIKYSKKLTAISPKHPLSPEKLLSHLTRLQLFMLKSIKSKKISHKINQPISQLIKVLSHIDKVNRIFQPFIYDNHYVFCADAIANLKSSDVAFDLDIRQLDWSDYFEEVHIPGLIRWIFPKYKKMIGTKRLKKREDLSGLSVTQSLELKL